MCSPSPDQPRSAPVTAAVDRVRALAFYLPQFHPVPENDAWWEPGFTEWTNVTRATPAFLGHHQPHLPADLGFYDLRVPEVQAAQARLAQQYGIDGFVYYHYWFQGRRLLERPFEQVRVSGAPDLPFALCWANEDWRSRWNGSSGALLVEQTYSDADDEDHIRYLVECFRDPRYVRVDGKPLFLVYRAAALPDPARTAALWRRRAREAGVGELMLVRVESGFPGEHGDPAAIGFDAAVEFQPDWGRLPSPDPTLAPRFVTDYDAAVDAMLAKPDVPYRRFPGVTPRWDNTARRAEDATVLRGSSPEGYGRWLRTVVDRVRERDADPVVFVNAWNEWAEGAHLEPCSAYGHAYLEAHAAAIGPSAPGTPPEVRDSLTANLQHFRRLERQAVRSAAGGDDEQALRTARAAADWAWYDHTGLFFSPALEHLLESIGQRLDPIPAARAQPGTRRRVLHVLTQGHGVGGHTRLAWRWMKQDPDSRHEVVLTDQEHAPAALAAAAHARGGQVHSLRQPTLLGRARALRALAGEADVVVLHVHPYDVIAAVAFAGRSAGAGGPSTVLVNHADHVFWIGICAADLVVQLRDTGDQIAVERRGVDPERLVRLPLPLEPPPARQAASVARRRLDLPHDATVLLTVASPYKFGATGSGLSLLDLVLPLLEAREDLVLLAAGPDASLPAWAEAARRTGGRVRALGYRDDLDLLHQSADVYLDSYPFGSPTSLLESGLAGLPALTYLPVQDLAVLSADSPGLRAGWFAAATVEEYRSFLVRMLDDRAYRTSMGHVLARSIEAAHCGSAWAAQLQAVYAAAQVATRACAPSAVSHQVPGLLDDALLQLHLAGGMTREHDALLVRHGLGVSAVPASADPSASSVPVGEAPLLSVVLAVDDRADATVKTLRTVLAECGHLGRLEAIVVDNASTDHTQQVLEALAEDVVSARFEPKVDPATAWRQGISMATGELVLALTNDVRLTPGFLAPLLSCLGESEGSTAAAPLLKGVDVRPSSGPDTLSGVCFLAPRRSLVAGVHMSLVTVPDSPVVWDDLPAA